MADEQAELVQGVDGQGVEFIQESGGRWLVTIIKAGRSLNGNLYTPEVLKAAAPLFEGRPLQAFDVGGDVMGHLPVKVQSFLQGGLLKATVGVLRGVRWDDQVGGLVAEAVITSPWVADLLGKLKEATGTVRAFGLSISAAADAIRDAGGRAIQAFRHVDSVDVVTTPAAGGQFTRAIEALIEEQGQMSEQTIDVDAIRESAKAEAQAVREEAAREAAAIRAELAAERHQAAVARVVESMTQGQPAKVRRMVERSVLADVAQGATEDAIRESVKGYVDDLPRPTQAETISGNRIQVLRSGEDKLQAALNGLLGVAEGDEAQVPAFRGIQEAYKEWTGDYGLERGLKVQEASGQTSSSPFTVGMGAALHRRLRKAYNSMDFGAMKLVSTRQRVNDFKSHYIIGVGGFGDLSAVAEDGAYVPLTVPAEEAPTVAVTKYGNLVTLTWESIVNDDLGITARHTDRLGKAARRTLEKAIFALFSTNSGLGATLWDSKAWFKSDGAHGNYGTTALGYASILAAEDAIAAQAELTSSEPLGINAAEGGYIIIPRALRTTAMELVRANLKPGTANNDGSALNWSESQIVVDPFATDATNWYMMANPAVWEQIVLAFLFGKEEPELLTADAATAYSMWNSDVIEFKVRHIWGLSVVDYRAAYGSVVAG